MVMDGSASKLYSQTDIARITNTTKIRVSRFLKKHKFEGIRQETALLYHQDALDAYKEYLESQKEKDEKRAKLPSKEALYHQLVTTQAEQNQALMKMVENQSKQIENYNELFKQQQAQIDSLKDLVKKLPEPNKNASEKDKIDYDKLSESFTKAFESLKNESEDDKKGGFWSNLFH